MKKLKETVKKFCQDLVEKIVIEKSLSYPSAI